MFTQQALHQFALEWYRRLSVQEPVEQLFALLAPDGFELTFPEAVLRTPAEFTKWYDGICAAFTEESHHIESFAARSTVDGVAVDVVVNWRATNAADRSRIGFRATQQWQLVAEPVTGRPLISKYTVTSLVELTKEERDGMTPRETINRYYELANAGAWTEWCDLFTEDVVMDEQLAGHVEGLGTLRAMMGGMSGYAKFANVPKHVVVSGAEGAVVSQIDAVTAAGVPVSAGVMNYFRFAPDGRIAYMANYHDSVPFQPFLHPAVNA